MGESEQLRQVERRYRRHLTHQRPLNGFIRASREYAERLVESDPDQAIEVAFAGLDALPNPPTARWAGEAVELLEVARRAADAAGATDRVIETLHRQRQIAELGVAPPGSASVGALRRVTAAELARSGSIERAARELAGAVSASGTDAAEMAATATAIILLALDHGASAAFASPIQAALREAVAATGLTPWPQAALTVLAVEAGAVDEAAVLARGVDDAASAMRSGYAPLLLATGLAVAAAGSFGAAQERWARALGDEPSAALRPTIAAVRGEALASNGQFAEALPFLREARAARLGDGMRVRIGEALAMAFAGTARFDEAYREVVEVVDLLRTRAAPGREVVLDLRQGGPMVSRTGGTRSTVPVLERRLAAIERLFEMRTRELADARAEVARLHDLAALRRSVEPSPADIVERMLSDDPGASERAVGAGDDIDEPSSEVAPGAPAPAVPTEPIHASPPVDPRDFESEVLLYQAVAQGWIELRYDVVVDASTNRPMGVHGRVWIRDPRGSDVPLRVATSDVARLGFSRDVVRAAVRSSMERARSWPGMAAPHRHLLSLPSDLLTPEVADGLIEAGAGTEWPEQLIVLAETDGPLDPECAHALSDLAHAGVGVGVEFTRWSDAWRLATSHPVGVIAIASSSVDDASEWEPSLFDAFVSVATRMGSSVGLVRTRSSLPRAPRSAPIAWISGGQSSGPWPIDGAVDFFMKVALVEQFSNQP